MKEPVYLGSVTMVSSFATSMMYSCAAVPGTASTGVKPAGTSVISLTTTISLSLGFICFLLVGVFVQEIDRALDECDHVLVVSVPVRKDDVPVAFSQLPAVLNADPDPSVALNPAGGIKPVYRRIVKLADDQLAISDAEELVHPCVPLDGCFVVLGVIGVHDDSVDLAEELQAALAPALDISLEAFGHQSFDLSDLFL